MKQVTYAGKVFMTGDAIADALIEAVAALGATNGTRALEIPVIDVEHPAGSTVSIVIGPSSEIIASPAEWSGEEFIDDRAVNELRELVRSLNQVSRPVAVAVDDDFDQLDPDFDDWTRNKPDEA